MPKPVKKNRRSVKKSSGIKVAVLGTGNMGRHHVRNYYEMRKTELVGIMEPDEERAAQYAKKFRCRRLNDLKELKDLGVQAVTAAIPTPLHFETVQKLLDLDLDILCEKPIAATLEQADKMIAKASRKKQVLMVGHVERFNPAVIKLKQMIDQGVLGQIKTITFQRMGLLPSQIKTENVMHDIGIHDIDMANHLLKSRPLKIWARGKHVFNSKLEDVVDAMLAYPETTVHFQCNWITPHKVRRMTIAGTGGFADLNFLTQEIHFWQHNYSMDYNDFGDFMIKFGAPRQKQIILGEAKEPLRSELEEFLRRIETRENLVDSAKDGRDALHIALEINRLMEKI